MEEDADSEEEEVEEGSPEDFLPALVDVGDVPLVGELSVAEGIAEHVLDEGRTTMMKQMKKE